MDHRWGQRASVDIDVRLACGPRAVGSGRLRDVSMSGGFVQTRLDLPLLAQVEVRIEVEAYGGSESYEIPAWIVRHEKSGIGLEWREFAPPAIRAFLPGVLETTPLPAPAPRSVILRG